jgi:hypothetical protein
MATRARAGSGRLPTLGLSPVGQAHLLSPRRHGFPGVEHVSDVMSGEAGEVAICANAAGCDGMIGES